MKNVYFSVNAMYFTVTADGEELDKSALEYSVEEYTRWGFGMYDEGIAFFSIRDGEDLAKAMRILQIMEKLQELETQLYKSADGLEYFLKNGLTVPVHDPKIDYNEWEYYEYVPYTNAVKIMCQD